MSRRRSNGIEADNFDDYLYLAEKNLERPKSSDGIFYVSSNLDKENLLKKSRRRSSCDFSGFNFNEKDQILEDEKEVLKLNKQQLSTDSTMLIGSYKQKNYTFMVLGESILQKKEFIYSCFSETYKQSIDNENISFEYTGNQNQQPDKLLDLIVKSKLSDDEQTKFTYKFWVQNISHTEDNYEKIVQVYYQNSKIFYLLYNSSSAQSFEKIKTAYQEIKSSKISKNYIIILMGIQLSEQKVISTEEGQIFSRENDFCAFYETKEDNSIQNLQILEFSIDMLDRLKY